MSIGTIALLILLAPLALAFALFIFQVTLISLRLFILGLALVLFWLLSWLNRIINRGGG